MTPDNTDLLVDSLERILEREHAALLNGNISEIADLAADKENVLANLNKAELQIRNLLVPLQSKIQRNQALLESALEGIRSVADRIAEMREIRNKINTYDRSGAKQSISVTRASKIEKRA